ncbi:9632_t:CDS:1, partial [Gigaspora margarita]
TLEEAIVSACRVKVSEYYSKQIQEKRKQRRIEKELGNLLQKIKKIALNYDTFNKKCYKEPYSENR